jgi:hypothetical protein
MTVEEYNKIPLNEDILIKYSCKDDDKDEILNGYYVVKKEQDGPDYYGRYVFVEAGGDEHALWNISCVEDWIPCKELDKKNKKGCWVYREDTLDYQCSECGRVIETKRLEHPCIRYPYCHCGAKMEKAIRLNWEK